jgi:hypothetical protein
MVHQPEIIQRPAFPPFNKSSGRTTVKNGDYTHDPFLSCNASKFAACPICLRVESLQCQIRRHLR